MAPKRKPQPQLPKKERFKCEVVEGEPFYAPTQDVFTYNWWEVFCFPYILCARVWDCCMNLCAGTNHCLLYWMLVQWIVCKITKITTPNPILFPYYFYLFCQVILLTIFFCLIWSWIGRSVVLPYLNTFYVMFAEDEEIMGTTEKSFNKTRLAFRRYCFKKSEIFEGSFDKDEMNNRQDRLLCHTGLLVFGSIIHILLKIK